MNWLWCSVCCQHFHGSNGDEETGGGPALGGTAEGAGSRARSRACNQVEQWERRRRRRRRQMLGLVNRL